MRSSPQELEGRTFHFSQQLWSVRETPARSFDAPETSHLLFESETAVRRVRRFPANWRELSVAALYALSWGR